MGGWLSGWLDVWLGRWVYLSISTHCSYFSVHNFNVPDPPPTTPGKYRPVRMRACLRVRGIDCILMEWVMSRRDAD